jgi:hypothetical protein
MQLAGQPPPKCSTLHAIRRVGVAASALAAVATADCLSDVRVRRIANTGYFHGRLSNTR